MRNDDWLFREEPDSFYEEAGTYSQEEAQERFKEIPEEHRPLAYIIISLVNELPPELTKCMEFRQVLFMSCKKILDEDGVDLGLPYYWYRDGMMIEPEVIVRATNGIIGHRCDESRKGCGMKGECRFYPEDEDGEEAEL